MNRLSLRMPSGIRINKWVACLCVLVVTGLFIFESRSKPSDVEQAIVLRNRRATRQKYTFNPHAPFVPFDIKRQAHLAKRKSPRLLLYEELNSPKEDFAHECVPLKTLIGQTSICIYDKKEDLIVSGMWTGNGTWQNNNLDGMGHIILDDPNIVLLDIGCNIGAYTIYAAKFGTKVVGIDPLAKNLQLLSESVKRLGLQDQVVLLWNVVSDVDDDLKSVHSEEKISTGTKLFKNLNDTREGISVVNYTAPSITMDDLVPLLEGKAVFIKMAIESHEMKALKSSMKFFEVVDVRCVVMEVVPHLHSKDRRIVWIDTYLQGFGLKPYQDGIGKTSLSSIKYKDWPSEVFWIKKRIYED